MFSKLTKTGYHRLWAHRSYRASLGLQYFLAVVGAGQWQLSILRWARHHRAHHSYTDTDRDPYDARKGFFHTHLGWVIEYKESSWGVVDLSDLQTDPVVQWQNRYYWVITVLVSMVLPTALAHYGWGDWQGGLLYGSFGRVVLTLHTTFLINSLAHATWAGTQPYSTTSSARNVPILDLFTAGEGNHNFHHTFPTDYRNGLHWFEPDISRHLIALWAKLGLASHLLTVGAEEIERVRLQSRSSSTHTVHSALPYESLPAMSWDKYVDLVYHGRSLVSIEGVIYDVADFVNTHPGGAHLIQKVLGEDATGSFYSAIHSHSERAEAQLAARRIAYVKRWNRDNFDTASKIGAPW